MKRNILLTCSVIIFFASFTSCNKGSVLCTIHDESGLVDNKVYKGEKKCENKITDGQFCECVHRVK